MIFEKMFDVVKQEFGRKDYKRKGSDPHANFEQSHPAVNKDEPSAFVNSIEAGAKMFSDEQCGRAMPRTFDVQLASDYVCPKDAHAWKGSNPHANFEQGHPAVNKDEPVAFANACESGAKKPSEAQFGKPMPESTRYCQFGDQRIPV